MTLQEATDYLGYCAKEGVFDPDTIEGMKDAEIIKLAEKMMDQADAAYETWKEDHE